jgi:hypothetical protein
MYTCPVCYFYKLAEEPKDYNICECCGTEFGNDDCDLSHEELRNAWIDSGARWFFREPPPLWNPWTQLLMANVGVVPYLPAAVPAGYQASIGTLQYRHATETVEEYEMAVAA